MHLVGCLRPHLHRGPPRHSQRTDHSNEGLVVLGDRRCLTRENRPCGRVSIDGIGLASRPPCLRLRRRSIAAPPLFAGHVAQQEIGRRRAARSWLEPNARAPLPWAMVRNRWRRHKPGRANRPPGGAAAADRSSRTGRRTLWQASTTGCPRTSTPEPSEMTRGADPRVDGGLRTATPRRRCRLANYQSGGYVRAVPDGPAKSGGPRISAIHLACSPTGNAAGPGVMPLRSIVGQCEVSGHA